jgi:hypothetical protein
MILATLQLTVKCEDSDDIRGIKELAAMRLEDLGEVKILTCEQWSPEQMLLDAMAERKAARR